MKFSINNFCDNSPIEFEGLFYREHGPIICIQQRGESMSFQHDLRPEQAREMAAGLLTAANKAEELQAADQRKAEVSA